MGKIDANGVAFGFCIRIGANYAQIGKKEIEQWSGRQARLVQIRSTSEVSIAFSCLRARKFEAPSQSQTCSDA